MAQASANWLVRQGLLKSLSIRAQIRAMRCCGETAVMFPVLGNPYICSKRFAEKLPSGLADPPNRLSKLHNSYVPAKLKAMISHTVGFCSPGCFFGEVATGPVT